MLLISVSVVILFKPLPMRLLSLLIVFIFILTSTNAQTDTLLPLHKQHVYGLMFHDATILVHTKQVENTRGASPKGIGFEISTQHSGSDTYKRWGFYSRNGVMLSYFNFNTPILGSTYSAAYFLEPIFKLGNKAELRVKAAMGMGYLTNPNPGLRDSSTTANFNYGSNLNGYLQVSVGASVHFTQHISGYLGANFNHNSNAGFAIPNRGVNYPSLSIGVVYHTKNNSLPYYKREKDNSWKKNNATQYYVGVFDASKDGWTGIGIIYKKQLLIGGTAFAAKRVSNVNAFTAGVEMYYDGGLALTKLTYNDNTSSIFASVLLGNEFYLNKFVLSQQLGYHLYRNTDSYNEVYLRNINPIKNFYQRYGIAYQFTPKYRLGFNFLARGDAADFFDFRILYRLK